jgi:hypothetical protein
MLQIRKVMAGHYWYVGGVVKGCGSLPTSFSGALTGDFAVVPQAFRVFETRVRVGVGISDLSGPHSTAIDTYSHLMLNPVTD